MATAQKKKEGAGGERERKQRRKQLRNFDAYQNGLYNPL